MFNNYLNVGSLRDLLVSDNLLSTIITSLLPPSDKTRPSISETVPKKNPTKPANIVIKPPAITPPTTAAESFVSIVSFTTVPESTNVDIGNMNIATPRRRNDRPNALLNVGAVAALTLSHNQKINQARRFRHLQ